MPGKPLRAFISFSSRDSRLVTELTVHLKRHGIEVWEYSRPGDRIAPGASILDTCQAKIKDSNCVIALVTASSCDPQHGEYPRAEVEFSLELRETQAIHIVPLYDTASPPPANLPAPYSQISGLLRMEVDSREAQTISDEVEKLCVESFSLDPAPSVPIDVRIKLIDRFRDEINKLSGLKRHLEVDMKSRALKFSERASKGNLNKDDWKYCHRVIDQLLGLAEDAGIAGHLYFPFIMRTLCEFELGRFADVMDYLDNSSHVPNSDYHLTALRALIAHEAGDYRRALEILKEDSGAPWEFRFNAAVAALAAGQIESVEDAMASVDIGQLEADDRCRVWTAMGVEHLRRHDFRTARGYFGKVLADGSGAARQELVTSAAGFSDSLIHLDDFDLAVDFLLQWYEKLSDSELLYRAARYLREVGEYERSLQYLSSLARDKGPNRFRYLVALAVTYDLMGDGGNTANACELIVTSRATATSPEDHYNVGLAYHLLRDDNRAKDYLQLARAKDTAASFPDYRQVYPGRRERRGWFLS